MRTRCKRDSARSDAPEYMVMDAGLIDSASALLRQGSAKPDVEG